VTTSEPLSIRETREGAVHRLIPIGELDLATAPLLENAFSAALRDEQTDMIVMDLTELSFMDSTGIRLLVQMHGACQAADRLPRRRANSRCIGGSRSASDHFERPGPSGPAQRTSRYRG
jgi:anti-anti-sigma regulatory factor